MNKKTLSLLLILVMILTTVAGVSGCADKTETQETVSQSAAETSEDTTQSTAEELSADGKLAWNFLIPHPFGEAVKEGVLAFAEDFGIDVEISIGSEGSYTEQTNLIEALLANGYRNFAMYPSDATAVNSLYEEIVAAGGTAITFGAPCTTPTPGSFLVATDVYAAESMATEKLIEMMGEEGSILNVLESLTDPNTVLRKQAIEAVVAKYPNVNIVQEIADMTTNEEALVKIEDGIYANIDNIDGIICTGATGSIALSSIMEEYYQKNDKKIWVVVVDEDPTTLLAIENGYIDATRAQNPFGIGYISMVLSKYMAEGWVPKEGAYFVDTGAVMVTKDNLETYGADIEAVTQEIVSKLEADYVEKP